MRLAHFISHFPYESQFEETDLAERYVCSGGEIAAYKVLKNLAKLGHEVIIFTSSVDSSDLEETYDGLEIIRYGSWFKIGDTRASPKLLWGPLQDVGRADIVHVQHTTPPGGLAGLLSAGVCKKPLIVTHHGFERFDNYGSLARKAAVYLSANLFVDILLSRASAIISLSPHFQKDSRFLWKYQEKTVVIPNGVDLDEYGYSMSQADCRDRLVLPKDHHLVLFMGSLMPRKGVDVLIKAMKRASETLPDTELIIVGRGPMEQQLRRMVVQEGLTQQVRFEGFVAKSSKKAMYYRAADILVVPSVNSMEMFPLVLLEGSAAGCAMVVSDLQTFKTIIHENVNGVVTKAGDEVSLALGILSVLCNSDLRKKLSHEALKFVQPFSWTAVAKQTEALYENLLNHQPVGGIGLT